jgi:hypothetical protein
MVKAPVFLDNEEHGIGGKPGNALVVGPNLFDNGLQWLGPAIVLNEEVLL